MQVKYEQDVIGFTEKEWARVYLGLHLKEVISELTFER